MRALFFVILFVVIGFLTKAQPVNEVTLHTVSGGPVSVCYGAQTITVTISNNNAVDISDLVLYTGLPQGVYFDGTIVGLPAPSGYEGNSPYFQLSGTLAAGESRTVSYSIRATCELLDYIEQNFGSVDQGYVTHATALDYMEEGVQMQYSEPSGSESYSVLSPDLEVYVLGADINQSNYLTDRPFFRHISIVNSGQGGTDKVTFRINKDASLTIGALYVTDGSNGTDGSMEANGDTRLDVTQGTLIPISETDTYLEYQMMTLLNLETRTICLSRERLYF